MSKHESPTCAPAQSHMTLDITDRIERSTFETARDEIYKVMSRDSYVRFKATQRRQRAALAGGKSRLGLDDIAVDNKENGATSETRRVGVPAQVL